VRKTKIHRGIDCPKKCGLAKQECRWAANSQLTKKSVADRHHGFHIKQADADGCWFPPDREHVFLTYHPETKNGLAPKCPSIYY
jgi:hypothetical protein